MKYDVVVVGAGPAGSMAARRAAEGGVSVLLMEKHPAIGSPVHCAEALPKQILKELDLRVEPRCIANEVKGVYIHTSTGERIPFFGEQTWYSGYVLERKVFDKFLAMEAARAGADLMVRAQVVGVIKENGVVKGVKALKDGKKVEVRADIVIAADGIESMVARWAGLNTSIKLDDYISGYQYEMVGVQLEEPEIVRIYYGSDVALGGYAWIFPKGEDVANVGLGIRGKSSEYAKECLDRFVKREECLKKAKILEIKVGGVPVGGPIKKFVLNGFMVVGTAARLVNPMTGGGMSLGMSSGVIAGEVASQAVKEGNYDARRLYDYQKRFMDVYGDRLRMLLRFRKALDKMSDEEVDELLKLFPKIYDFFNPFKKVSYMEKITFIIKEAPRLAKFFRALLF